MVGNVAKLILRGNEVASLPVTEGVALHWARTVEGLRSRPLRARFGL